VWCPGIWVGENATPECKMMNYNEMVQKTLDVGKICKYGNEPSNSIKVNVKNSQATVSLSRRSVCHEIY
jgi:hypothetical protein